MASQSLRAFLLKGAVFPLAHLLGPRSACHLPAVELPGALLLGQPQRRQLRGRGAAVLRLPSRLAGLGAGSAFLGAGRRFLGWGERETGKCNMSKTKHSSILQVAPKAISAEFTSRSVCPQAQDNGNCSVPNRAFAVTL